MANLLWIPKRLVEIGLLNVAAKSPKDFVAYGEEEYAKNITKTVDEILSAGAHIVMLSGPSGSGKTTSACKIAEELVKRGTSATVMSLDDFYHNADDYPRFEDGTKDYENILALDVDSIHSSLLALLTNGSADFPVFDFTVEKRKKETHRIELNGGVLIVEGIHALNPLLTDVLPQGSVYKVYAGLREEYSMGGQRFLPTRDIRLARRMVRDHRFRGQPLRKTIEMWPMVNKGEDDYIRIFKQSADCLLDTSFSYEPGLLAQRVISYKGEVTEDCAAVGVLRSLVERFSVFLPIEGDVVPVGSMLREFIG